MTLTKSELKVLAGFKPKTLFKTIKKELGFSSDLTNKEVIEKLRERFEARYEFQETVRIGSEAVVHKYSAVKPARNIQQFKNEIITAYERHFGETRNARKAILKFTDSNNESEKDFFKTVNIDNLENDIERILIEGSLGVQGSDIIPSNYSLDFNYFEVKWINLVNRGGNRENKASTKKYWKTLNPVGGKKDDCYFACIKRFFKMKKTASRLRKESGLIGKIYLKDLPEIAKRYDYSQTVYSDTKEKIILYESDVLLPRHINLVLSDEHYEIALERRKKLRGKAKEKVKKEDKRAKLVDTKKSDLVFFDFETFYDKNNKLHVYAGSWFKTTLKDGFEFSEDSLRDCVFYKGSDTVSKFFDYIEDLRMKKHVIIIGYNNSRFDNYFLIDEGIKRDVIDDIFRVNGAILKMGNLDSLDLCKFINNSLDNACKSYKTNPAKKPDLVSHNEIQKIYEKGELDTWLENNKEIEEYTKMDVLSLVDLFFKFRDSVLDLTDKELMEYLTIGSMGYQTWLETIDPKILSNINSYEDVMNIRSCLIAGRSQAFYSNRMFDLPVQALDVVSLYPYSMRSREFPIGEYKKTNRYIPGKLGIYSCKVVSQNIEWYDRSKIEEVVNKYSLKDIDVTYAPCIIPKRIKGEALDWTHRGELDDIRLTSVDIECLKRHNCEVEVYSGIYWEKSSKDVFKEYVDLFMNAKNEQDLLKAAGDSDYNPALREVCKLFSNSLSGKVIEKIHSEDFKQYKNHQDYIRKIKKLEPNSIDVEKYDKLKFVSGTKKEEAIVLTKIKPIYLGVFIYAYSREYMYDTCLNRYLVLQTDTDSAFMPLCEVERFEKENERLCPIGRNKEYGDWERDLEQAGKRFYAMAPKCYLAVGSNKDGSNKARFKGVRKGWKWSLDKNMDMRDYLENGKDALSEEMYQELLKGNTIYIYCSMLQKCKKKEDRDYYDECELEVRQVFMIKELKNQFINK